MAEKHAHTVDRLLLGAILLGLGLALAHQSAGDNLLLGRYSLRYGLALAALVAFSLGAWAALLFRPQAVQRALTGLFERWGWLITLAMSAALALVWSLPIENALKMFPSIVGLALLWRCGPALTLKPAFVALGLGLLFAVYGLALGYVPVHELHDEGAYAYMAQMHAETGRLGGDLYDYPTANYIGFGSWLVVQDVWFRALGWGWWEGRALALIWGLIAAAGLYGAARLWFGAQAALTAVLLLALSGVFMASLRIRPDMPVIALFSLSLWAWAWAERGPTWRYALLGFIISLALEAHLLVLAFWGAYGLALGLPWLYDCLKERRWRWPWAVIAFVLGALPPIALYLITHILPDLLNGSVRVISDPGSWTLGGALSREVQRWMDYGRQYPLEALLLLAALPLAWQIKAPNRRLLGVLLSSVLAYLVVAPSAQEEYTRYFLPFFILLIASVIEAASRRVVVVAALAALFGVAAPALLQSVELSLRQGLNPPQPPAVTLLLDTVPAGETVITPTHLLMSFDPTRYHIINASPNPSTMAQLHGIDPDSYYPTLNPAAILLDPTNILEDWLQRYLDEAEFVRLPDQGDIRIFVRPDLYESSSS